jgi:hypothetical protein
MGRAAIEVLDTDVRFLTEHCCPGPILCEPYVEFESHDIVVGTVARWTLHAQAAWSVHLTVYREASTLRDRY